MSAQVISRRSPRGAAHLLPHCLVVAVIAGLTVSAFGGAPWWVAGVVAAGLLLCAGRPGPAAVTGLAALLFAGGWLWGSGRMQQTAPAAIVASGSLSAVAVVDAAPRRRAAGGWRATVRVREVLRARDAGLRGARLIVWLRAAPPPLGSVVAVEGTLAAAARPDAPAWWRRYLERQGISGSVGVAGLPVLGRRGGVDGLRDRSAAWLRGQMGDRLEGERGALVQGMALGGTQGLEPETEEQVRDAGLAHLLAVSGQNVAVVALVVSALLGALGIARRRALSLVALMVVAYCLVCEPGASVGRAGVVAVAAILAEGLSRSRDRWYLLLLALAALLAWQPRSIWDPGLQLSFTAVAGILAIGPPLRRAAEGVLPRWAAELAAMAAAAGFATAPVLVADFGRLSLAGFVTNLVAVPLASGVLIAALTGALTAVLPGPLGTVSMGVAGLGAEAILGLARAASAVPGSAVTLPLWCAPLAAIPAIAVWVAAEGRWRFLVARR